MRVSSSYEHALQSCYWDIGIRGIRVDPKALAEAGSIVDAEISRNLSICSNQWGCIVFVGAGNAPDEEEEDEEDPPIVGSGGGAVNINATQGQYALLKKLKDLGYNVPKITKKNEEGEYEQSYSAGELAIQKMLVENQFNYPGGDPALRAILKVRELGKLKTSYLNARLLPRGEELYFICIYNVAGTTTGRRSSKRHTFGFGNNGQNFPSHSSTASLFRKCLVPRHGGIFLLVDQVQAEDWPVQALAGNLAGLGELRAGVDRHSKMASAIFRRRVPAKTDVDWNEVEHDQLRYVGKKTRHANNYAMTAPRFSDVLVQEAELSVPISLCKQMLDDAHLADPSVRDVFHKYVKETLSATRILITPSPFFRERQFISLRPTDGNSAGIKEAFAFIPQSTVADNTGFAVLELESSYPPEGRRIVQEGHDSLVQDLPDSYMDVYESLCRTNAAFDRRIRFQNGIEIQIPLEAAVGYSFADTAKIKEFSFQGVKEAMQKLQEKMKKTNATQIAISA